MKLTAIGVIQQISEEQTFGENGFKKKEVIIKTLEQYPNFYNIEFTQDNVKLLDGFIASENVSIRCNIKGREYKNEDNGNYNIFMSIVGWQIERV